MTSSSTSSNAPDGFAARVASLQRQVTARLLAELQPDGHWEGRLSSSALSTAVATFALAQTDPARFAPEIRRGLDWLAATRVTDGSWGDTPDSPGNLSTTLLCWSACSLVATPLPGAPPADNATDAWLAAHAGSLAPEDIAAAVLRHYGNDRTFSAPILTLCALAGRLGTAEQAWPLVPQLPFEIALLPHRFFRWLRLPVVSYAIPALIAIGLARHRHRPSRNPLARGLRNAGTARLLRKLDEIQPENGGFLEATPLTGFVVMCLAACGLRDHPVTTRGIEFLRSAQRPDGSWPIDTHLATWVTTLAVNALGPDLPAVLGAEQRANIRAWLLTQQFRPDERQGMGSGHPLKPLPGGIATSSADCGARRREKSENPGNASCACKLRSPDMKWACGPPQRGSGRWRNSISPTMVGGWSWTPLAGGVPDADDTAGALLALHRLGPEDDDATRNAAEAGIVWLLDLQNRDGGMPTFCRGWGKLPFDRSCPDLTAHAIRAFAVWLPAMSPRLQARMRRGLARGLAYLARAQRQDGSWLPLWFGNQAAPRHENPTYGTAQVLVALQALRGHETTPANAAYEDDVRHTEGACGGRGSCRAAAQRWGKLPAHPEVRPPWESSMTDATLASGERWLAAAQNPDGGWGGAPGVSSSIEETSLALAALAGSETVEREVLSRGVEWLAARVAADPDLTPAPLGLYFASLWYSERLYPVVFAALALRAQGLSYPRDATVCTGQERR